VELTGGKAAAGADYRHVLDNKAVDAVVITTPEHWHAIMCIDACDAGKDVYVEKPLANSIAEGALITRAARRYSPFMHRRSTMKPMFECTRSRSIARSMTACGTVGFIVRVGAFQTSTGSPLSTASW
jgi:hypothetical protein